MSEADLPMMPFFVKDWISATVHWPSAERGAYISYLCFQWVNRVLPADEVQLARIAGLEQEEFYRVWETVGKKFDSDERGLFNNRLEDVRKEAVRLRDARAMGASVANQKRRAKRIARHDAANDADYHAERNAPVTHTNTNTNTEKEKRDTAALPEQRSANAQRGPRGTRWNSDKWLTLKLACPHRAGGEPWESKTRRVVEKRLAEGHTWEELIAGAERYAKYCEAAGKLGTEYVMQMRRFFGVDKEFLLEWDIPPNGANDERWSPPSSDTEDPPDEAASFG